MIPGVAMAVARTQVQEEQQTTQVAAEETFSGVIHNGIDRPKE